MHWIALDLGDLYRYFVENLENHKCVMVTRVFQLPLLEAKLILNSKLNYISEIVPSYPANVGKFRNEI